MWRKSLPYSQPIQEHSENKPIAPFVMGFFHFPPYAPCKSPPRLLVGTPINSHPLHSTPSLGLPKRD